ncbi:MAG: pantetheine-phosphate adenylyltransferase [Candidatus Methanoperedens nitroreducens]|uniref:Phosphopantetheine adenylyltransferase n=1 Tax=Candidatus Methanoperedens nitratireducens TaxID=1392998 RepID=A0A0P8AAH2_9EURY|nr:phosphopantetheine adenylyltransferase [Candidatus Methanoperedens sp. BLZ2]KAB2946592.1 MAG: phosphopantetheine adenylyltransferase [Candidatus Methanoperedens sp.]KPQ40912.1 MAG: pantetheine-phosphate adenylyltransferase [Candidatus Methanoperedens sp. BLZ1]MBZ0173925.1 phosphopantetheine adenylyltransferase [Candidatus Methanoperedens nitroreducens]CAG0999259.1 pantetheine-phosphate adenylyltransferase [Methanosarcinales archaeon]MCX9078972.1 phosphopantetheine adenylyltransferase [Candi
MSRVAVGGTFDPLHDGHRSLLMKAVELGRDGELLIGLTSDEMAKNKIHEVDDYRSRYNEVLNFIHDQGIIPRIIKLDDPYGPTIIEDFDYLVVSPETRPIGLKINRIRSEKNMKPLKIVLVDYVLAEDGLPISSTRIRNGEIDTHGKVLRTNL